MVRFHQLIQIIIEHPGGLQGGVGIEIAPVQFVQSLTMESLESGTPVVQQLCLHHFVGEQELTKLIKTEMPCPLALLPCAKGLIDTPYQIISCHYLTVIHLLCLRNATFPGTRIDRVAQLSAGYSLHTDTQFTNPSRIRYHGVGISIRVMTWHVCYQKLSSSQFERIISIMSKDLLQLRTIISCKQECFLQPAAVCILSTRPQYERRQQKEETSKISVHHIFFTCAQALFIVH